MSEFAIRIHVIARNRIICNKDALKSPNDYPKEKSPVSELIKNMMRRDNS